MKQYNQKKTSTEKIFLEDPDGHELCHDGVENRVSYTITAFVIVRKMVLAEV